MELGGIDPPGALPFELQPLVINAFDQMATPAAMPESGKIVLLRGTECTNCLTLSAASLAQLVARRSHNPKVVSSILTGSILF